MKPILIFLMLAGSAAADAQQMFPMIIQEKLTLNPGKDTHQCFSAESNQTIRYRYKASGAIDFVLRDAAGTQISEAASQSATGEMAEFRPPQSGQWCWVWTNKQQAPLELSYDVEIGAPVPSTR